VTVTNTLITVIAFAFVLGVLVFVHELGHFLAAKRVGIRVLKFQLGFNPTIFARQWGDTVYSIGALPLGGYVKMAGDTPDDVARDERGQAVSAPDEFLSRSKWERFQVLVMGPAMNVLLAVVVTAFVLHHGAQVAAYQDQPPLVGTVMDGSPAQQADIRPGDLILSVAGHHVDTWEEYFLQIGSRPNQEVAVVLQRGSEELERNVMSRTPAGQNQFEVGDIGVLPRTHPHLESVEPDGAGARGGLEAGDIILSVNGEPIVFQSQLREAIAKHPEQAMSVIVQRGEVEKTLSITPARHSSPNGDIGFLGVLPADATKTLNPGPLEAIGMSVQRNTEYAGLIFQTVWGLITRQTSPRQLMGPVAIAQLSGESARLGLIPLLSLMASISLNLGLLNLLPIPILDGGHIFIMALEGLARRDFSVRVKEKMLLVGFVVLMMLMVTVIYNDLTRISWIERLMPWR
jgi:regulator of sigma E protease